MGDLLARLTGDVSAIERFLLSALSEGVSAIAKIAFFAGALFLLSWKLALASLIVAPLFYVASRRFIGVIKHASREKRRRSGSLSAVAEESLNAAQLTQTLNRQDAEVQRFRTENAAIMDAEMASTRISGLFGPLVGLIELVGGLLVFITYLAQLYSPIRSLGQLGNDVFAAAAGAERVLELLDTQPAVVDRPGARPLTRPAAGLVELRGVTYSHPGAAAPALRDVSLRVRPGEMVALTGPSGAGKSTLSRLLVRFGDPQAGAISLDGHDVRDITLASLRENVGLLLQDTYLPDLSAREAIAQGGRTTVVITHDPAVIAWADRVVELRDGALVDRACAASGT